MEIRNSGVRLGLALLAFSASASAQTSASFPFFDGFESGTLAPYWSVDVVSGPGQALVTAANGPHTGGFHLTMDATSSAKTIMAADLAVDLAGEEGVLLEFAWRDFLDGYDSQIDGIFLSVNGLDFTKVMDLNGPAAGEGYQELKLDLDKAAEDAGLAFASPFYIRFGWSGIGSIPVEGFAFDDVRLSSVGFSTLGKLVSQTPTSGGEFGASMTRIADLNADGVDELAIGHPDVAGARGRVEIFSGTNFSLISSATQNLVGDEFGRSLDVVGDLDGDGFDELLIGAPFNDQGGLNAGAAFVYSTKTGQQLSAFLGTAGDSFGAIVRGVPDMNGDGVMELLIGAPKADGKGGVDAGQVHLYSGSDSTELFVLDGLQAGGLFGSAIDAHADLDGDGIADIVVGSPEWDLVATNEKSAGAVGVYAGKDGALLLSLTGSAANERLGSSLSMIADLTGDGLLDLAVGAPDALSAAGAVRFFDGSNGTLLSERTGALSGERFGTSVRSVGDLDGDGVDEIAVGTDSSLAETLGYVKVFRAPGLEVTAVFRAASVDSGFGAALRGLGDMDGDGLDDVGLVSIREAAGSVSGAGMVRIVSTAGGPLIDSLEGLHSTKAGEVVLHGSNLFGHLVALVDGTQRAVTEVSPVEARIQVPIDVAGGFRDLTLVTDQGSVTGTGVVPRYPALAASSELALGASLHVQLDNGETGAFVLAFSNMKYDQPAPFTSFGWYHGLELNGLWVAAAGTFAPGATARELVLPGTTSALMVGTSFYLQAWTAQAGLGLAGFSNTVTTTITL